MKKYLLILVAGVFGILTANAWTVTVSTGKNGGTVATINCGDTGLPQNWSDFGDYRQSILDADTLIVEGNIGQYNLSAFNQGKGQTASNGETGFQAKKVDFSEAHFVETSHGNGPFTFYEYNPNSSVTPKYKMVKTTQGEQTTVSYVEDENGKYVKHENVYYKSNEMSFQYFVNVTEPVLSKYVESMCQNCINNLSSLTTTFTIPNNIKYLATGAVDNTPISSIVIPASVEYIESGAIKNAATNHLIDVTVESASTVCANGGFLKDITVGQTDAGYMNYAVLHFPEGAEEFFVNQDHELDLATSLNKGLFQSWLDKHYSNAGNGWQEFINSSPGGDPVPVDKPVVLRTFSDNVAHYVPLCYRAYIVNGVKKIITDEGYYYTLKLQETFAIPANTGVIIYGEAATGSFALPILSGASWNTNPYDRTPRTAISDNKEINLQNLLVANCTLASGTKIGPYELGSDGTVAERNFVMGPYSKTDMGKDASTAISTDYVAFFRAKTMTPGKNKAHLKLPNSPNAIQAVVYQKPEQQDKDLKTYYSEPKGVEVIAINPSEFRITKWPLDFAETGNWGEKPRTLPPFFAKSFGEPNEDATAISNVIVENAEDGAIYTLQGVKVENPSKGVYIQNGKKFIVK